MTTVPAGSMAMLDRLTDPATVALAELRAKLAELSHEVAKLETAKDEKGADVDTLALWMLADDTWQVLGKLTRALESHNVG